MRKLDSKIIVVLVLVFSGALYFFMRSENALGPEEQKDSSIGPMTTEVKNPTAGVVSTSEAVSSKEAVLQDQTSTQPHDFESIQTWLNQESKNLDQPHVDTKQKDLELKNKVENFSDAEKKFILELAHNTQKSANERILAAYMLVLDQSRASFENLENMASKALPDFGPVNAHSEAEVRRGQELAVRYMAIDEFVKRASVSPEALESLKKLAGTAESAEVRDYARKKLQEIK